MTEQNSAFGQAPTFGQAPAFGQAPVAPAAPTFGQAPVAPAAPTAPTFGQASPVGAQGPAFATGAAPTQATTYAPVTAVDLGWITPEEQALCAQYENNYEQIIHTFDKRFDISIKGTVAFSAVASPFLPKEDRKQNGRLWEVSVTITNVELAGDAPVFARYALAKRLRYNKDGLIAYTHSTPIPNTTPEMTRDQVKQVAMAATTRAGLPARIWPVPFMDINNSENQQLLSEKDFSTTGNQSIVLVLSLSQTSNLASVAKYAWYKPYLQAIKADFNDLHFNEYAGNTFRNAQDHALEMARQLAAGGTNAVQPGFGAPQATGFEAGYGEPAQAPGFGAPAQAPGFGAPAQAPGFGAPAQAPGFGAPAQAPGFGAPAQAPGFGAPAQAPGFGAPAQAPGFGAPAQAPGFGAPAQAPGFGAPAQAPGFGAPAQAPGFGAPAQAPADQPFATPFGGTNAANPFAN